jgi:hypothetical protein
MRMVMQASRIGLTLTDLERFDDGAITTSHSFTWRLSQDSMGCATISKMHGVKFTLRARLANANFTKAIAREEDS